MWLQTTTGGGGEQANRLRLSFCRGRLYSATCGRGLETRPMPTQRLNDAIRACLARCRGSHAPLAVLAAYLDELRQQGWTEYDVHAVETAVVRLLSAISDSDLSTID